MLGYPGSGKSYFARKLSEKEGIVRLNADSLRTKLYGSIEDGLDPATKPIVFDALDYAAVEVLRVGHSVIFDAQHRSRADRHSSAQVAKEAGVPAVVVWIKTPRDIAIDRIATREAQHDQQQLGREEASAKVDRAESLFEDFVDGETVIEIDGTASFEDQYNTLMSQIG